MLSMDSNDILTRVGPGTPMGDLMREYWIPACLPQELERDATPMRLKLLGEKLIAFRDSSGRIGIMDHRCPHRCASMFFGRNEEGGIRCAYHGWKFDVDGNCLDMPNIPEDQRFTERVKAKAYKVAELGGMVWVYMGKRAVPPPLPALEVFGLPASERMVLGSTSSGFTPPTCRKPKCEVSMSPSSDCSQLQSRWWHITMRSSAGRPKTSSAGSGGGTARLPM